MTQKPPGTPPLKAGAAPAAKPAASAVKPAAAPAAKPVVAGAKPVAGVAPKPAVAPGKPGAPVTAAVSGKPVATTATIAAAVKATVAAPVTGGSIGTRVISLSEPDLKRLRDSSQDAKTAQALIDRRLGNRAIDQAVSAVKLANGSREVLQFVARGVDLTLTMQALQMVARLDANADAVLGAITRLPAPLNATDREALAAAAGALEAVAREAAALGKKYFSVKR